MTDEVPFFGGPLGGGTTPKSFGPIVVHAEDEVTVTGIYVYDKTSRRYVWRQQPTMTDAVGSFVSALTHGQVLSLGKVLGMDMRNAAADFNIPLGDDLSREVVRRKLREILGE